ncbi:Dot/Icm T4SS effector [Legionella busanensis]|uniref:Dot/Icm T4SS effector n=1 Tax=Legionella busanensis TaxID=190655 RepID=A0A378JN00_9GAMM|nr:hypothetical protein [Legionella busanensis]STX52624.1 Dot/Icm T4SS effector [Legionella busanensis]
METFEHKTAGDQIRIETFNNPYLHGSDTLNPNPKNKLTLTLMHLVDGIPVPLALTLSAGDIVALAGDYYTKAGWGNELELPLSLHKSSNVYENRQLIDLPIKLTEQKAFNEAYHDLASPAVKKTDIKRIYSIEDKLPRLLQQLVYAFTVKNYGAKLVDNEAHFAPWSLRAYLVGHNTALKMSYFAYIFQQLAKKEITLESDSVPLEIKDIIRKVNSSSLDKNPFNFQYLDDNSIYEELKNRYHALAVSYELFTLHFYSDHFAGGHLSRIGLLRKKMPEQFGVWGSILINNMHNEDNTDGVTTTNSFQFIKYRKHKKFRDGSTHQEDSFIALHEDCRAYGDGTYNKRNNDENSNMLINGMDNSLGDIAHIMTTGHVRPSTAYGGLTFLPEIDYTKRQAQPLLIQGKDGRVYFRKNIRTIEMLSPIEYKNMLAKPTSYGYQELTKFKAFLVVFKLEVLGFYFFPKIKELTSIKQAAIEEQEIKQVQPKRLGVEADFKVRSSKPISISIQPVKHMQEDKLPQLSPKTPQRLFGFHPFWRPHTNYVSKTPDSSSIKYEQDEHLPSSAP